MFFDAVNEVTNSAVVEHMQCAVHTLQLVIGDGLKKKHAQNLIRKIRQIVLVARTPKNDNNFETQGRQRCSNRSSNKMGQNIFDDSACSGDKEQLG